MFEIKEISKKEEWESFLISVKEKTFLNSWAWGEMNLKQGNKIWRLGILKDNEILALVLVSKIVAKRGTFLLIQHGPSIKSEFLNRRAEILKSLIEKLKILAKEEKCSFARISSLLERNDENDKMFICLGFKKAPMHANAYDSTWKLDIGEKEEEILKNMRKTTRYIISRLAKNSEVSIEKSEKTENLEIYQKMNKGVAERQNFNAFSEKYLENEFETFKKDSSAVLFFGKHKGELAAAALVIFWQETGFYHQAASLPQFSKLSIPYLLQWEAIKEAKKRGCKIYDFWGYIDPHKHPNHPWAGPTLFKMGFGGKAYEYVKTMDFPFSKKYYLTYIFEKLRKIKRGL